MDEVGVHIGANGAVVGEIGGGVGDVVGVCGGDCLGGGAVAGVSVSLMLCRCDIGIDWEHEHGLCKVLLQGKVEVADLEFLGELEGCVGVLVAVLFGGARDPFVDRRLIRIVAPPA